MQTELSIGVVLDEGLQKTDTASTRAVQNDTRLYQFMLAIFKANVDLASGKPADVGFALAEKTMSSATFVSNGLSARGAKIGVGSANILLQSASLIRLNRVTSPGIALATVGATFATKTSIALGMVPDDERVKCLSALSDLAAGVFSVGVSAAAVSAVSGGILAPLALAGSIAHITLAAYNTHQTCIAE